MYSTSYSCQILIKLEFSGQIFEKYSNNNFNENPSSGGQVVPCARTERRKDRHDEANSCFFFAILRQGQKMRGAILHLHLTSSQRSD